LTVVLAVRCRDGLVIGSDSQITEADRGMSFPAQKLHELGPSAAWGGSGARSVLFDVEALFTAEAEEILGSRDVGRALQERVLPILRHHYDSFISDVPGTEGTGTPAAYVLAAGYSHDVPFIVKVAPNGLVGRYEDIGFHAIGSGAAMAQQAGALLGNYRMIDRPVAYGVVAVVRDLDSLETSSPSVGGPIDVARVTRDGGAHHLDDEEIAAVREDVERWQEMELDALDRLFEDHD
jgi:20S proteasome alpha/beta subunit